ncbi:MAG TPA: TetR/AcrR family transcriptional regulator [Planctomycetota bacterium]|nr:TetR/AcrR family transcriptional regulator [Planctomycetota bacterium]
MQVRSPAKRKQIVAAAARLFASRPFHVVRLEEVAAEARVGKGTLYVYFKSKDDLYGALAFEAFSEVLSRLKGELKQAPGTAREDLRRILRELVAFADRHPHLFALAPPGTHLGRGSTWLKRSRELAKLVEAVIRRGIRNGEMRDPRPDLTAVCIPGLVRSVHILGSPGLRGRKLAESLARLVERGIAA